MSKLANMLYMIDLLNTGNIYTLKELSEKIQLIDLRKFNIHDFGGLIGLEDMHRSNVDLFDDNVLTGKTLQLAINSLYDYDIEVGNVCIVRYPSINRIDQMFLKNPAAIDYHLFFNYIYMVYVLVVLIVGKITLGKMIVVKLLMQIL